ncbi:MAG: class I SAM-dependent methyltransferase [Planctomycetota bacterium]
MLRFASALVLLALLPSCHGAPPTPEASVKPGINQDFLDPALDVTKYEQRFEVESREIFAHRARIAGLLRLRAGMSVADVGAGTGLFTVMFAPVVGPAGTVYGVDIAEKFVAHIQQLAAQRQLRNVAAVLCSERSTALPATSVDLVFVCDTYHHFEYPQSTLASIHQALRPGGELVVVDFIREPGVSRQWVLDHVRAGLPVVGQEIAAAGFELVRVEDTPFLRENYMVRFRKQ